MRANGLINFVLVTSVTAALTSVVTKGGRFGSDAEAYDFKPSRYVLPPDTPEVETEEPELIYEFKDNDGRPPMLDPKSKLYLESPENIKSEVEYDPATGNYNVKQKVGDRDYRPETYMNLKEYKDYMFKKQMQEYWRSRVAADDLNNPAKQGIIPKLQVNSELFDRIFGGNTVDIKPTGTAELIFGLNRNKNLNPAIPQKQQKVTNFDFNMRIQLNLIGKIGEKLKVTTNYNTEASFDWENQVKVDYTGLEDEIIKKIEAGNVTLPLNSSLISGSQTLFGFKTELQFGKLRATTVFSQQRGKKQEITVQGGAQMQNVVKGADEYEHNKHYFLGHYFRKNYDKWMTTLPIVNTPVVLTRVEVYVLGINGNAEQTRNVVAFQDLGEHVIPDTTVLSSLTEASMITPGLAIKDIRADDLPVNNANNLYSLMTNPNNGLIAGRTFTDVASLATTSKGTNSLNINNVYMVEGRDYTKIQNARKLNSTEYTMNARLGYISLNQQLNNDQALAVSYQYTYRDSVYQVGEFSENVPDNSKILVCKLLKTNAVSVRHPMWHLMMKNVYVIGAYNLNPQDFKLDVYYNNIETGVDIPYLPASGGANGRQLIKVLGCDRLSVNGDPYPDGVYDFVNGYTALTSNGWIYLPSAEPFGRSLERTLDSLGASNADKSKFVFKELYDSTKTAATFVQEKNRYRMKVTYRSSSGSEIVLNAMNIPPGAVVVTANGMALVENTDYTVDYTVGRVKIINESILNSGAVIKVSLESNSLFSVQQKSLWGTRLNYEANRNLSVGGTFLRFNERPLTPKVSLGEEPVSNIIAGVDYNYKTDAPFLTRLLDKLPFYSTKEMSSITTRGEVAKLFPGNARAINTNGGNSYIDDFEGSVQLIDIRGAQSWFLASIPYGQQMFPEASHTNSITTGMNRARFNWYNTDQMFTRDQTGATPAHFVSDKLFSNNMWRQVFETELFPGKTPPNGQQVVLPILDLVFFPFERGPYNYDVNGVSGISAGINNDGTLKNPASRWGGIMRRLEQNDFQLANVEYIQFWMMDPFNEDYNTKTDPAFLDGVFPKGDLYINLGNISEDIVKDDRMSYENGIPTGDDNFTAEETNLALIPLQPPIVNAFSAGDQERTAQDVGYDGFNDAREREKFASVVDEMRNGPYSQTAKDAFFNDPSSDNFHHFRGDDFDAERANTISRYAKFNNPQGNSPTQAQFKDIISSGDNVMGSNLPNIEDVNRDNTMSVSENYYQYHLKISPEDVNPNNVGNNFLVDAFEGTAEFSGVTKKVRWYQFKIPISQFEKNVGAIEGFNSIRFMRVFVRGFERPVVMRLARFELVRSDWRRYQFDLRRPGEEIITDNNQTTFDISAVSLQENSNKIPVNYVMPPLIQQQQNVQTTNLVLMNEQALQMRVCDLRDGDSKAIFKNFSPELDSRMFNNIKMNVHAEAPEGQILNDGDLTLFFRVGTDYNSNYYEYEVPLKLTPKGNYNNNNENDRYAVWPVENEINFRFDDNINEIKTRRNNEKGYFSDLTQLSAPFSVDMGGYTITIVGNPNLATIKSLMVGIRNPRTPDRQSHCAEVWINELRLTDFINKGGYAATGQVQAKLADLGMLNLSGTYKSPFWGGVESKINERSRETHKMWDVSTSVGAGKFFPAKWKVSLPVYYNFGRTINTPLFNPLDPDQKMEDFVRSEIDPEVKQKVISQTQDFTERKGFNVSNVRIEGFKRAKAKPFPWDVSNFSATYAYNEIWRNSVNVEFNVIRQYRGNIQYAYSLKNPPTLKPFSKVKLFQNKWFALLKDFSLQLLPNSYGMSVDLNRSYAAQKNRDITSFYANSSDFPNPVLVNKNFTMTRNYNFLWTLNKSVKFDFAATNEGRIMERPGEVYSTNKETRQDIWNTFRNGRDTIRNGEIVKEGQYGENLAYRQQMNLNVDLPLQKFPALDFMKVSYRYGGTYTWQRKPFAAADYVGNTIQNTNTHNINGSLNMVQLYNKVPYLKRVNNPPPKKGAESIGSVQKGQLETSKSGNKAGSKKDTTEKSDNFKDFLELVAKTLMMLKQVGGTYQLSGGQALPNFNPRSQYLGLDFSNPQQAPGFLFTTGLYDPQIRQNAIKYGWLTRPEEQTTPYSETYSNQYNYRATVEPHGSLRVEFTGSYQKQLNKTSYILFDRSRNEFVLDNSPTENGSFQISTLTFFNAFRDGNDPVKSVLFDQFTAGRRDMAIELGEKNDYNEPGVVSFTTVQGQRASYVDGYDDNQQDVLLGTFNKVYAGKSTANFSTQNIFPSVPLPNWNVTWDGLGKIPALKKTFRGITVRHTYRSTYQLSGFSNNLLFDTRSGEQTARMPVSLGAGSQTLGANFVPYYNLASVTLRESFEPLIKFDLQFAKPGWSANVEHRRDKSTNLNISGLQIIETKGQEYILGIGYLYPKLKINRLKIQGKVLESNLTVKIDMSYRKNISVIRQITDGVSMPTAGTNILSLRSSADYALTQNVTLRLFYDWTRNTPQTSASFPTASTMAGFSLRITFQ